MSVSRRRRLARAAATTAAAVVTVLSVAPAAPADAAEPRANEGLFLTISGAEDTWIRGVLLRCPDTTGHHPHHDAACSELTWARGDLDALRGEQHACTKEYDPVTVAARGTWRGALVEWHRTFANACTMDAATGSVFRF
ncbi:SSI family serine proteinase inhibitor [Streptomyces sp. NPDC050161]|uniref:SSI family serine proteinase inhibitor n=1 Tax=Streptomyces sp. NPDC050161 TaxID=3365604 RepID=UPI0037B98ED8